jgi:predicted PolB exonuclease-like 3'-5' exonuclease
MQFAVFDIETRVDKQLLNRVFFPDHNISDDDAYARFREELSNRGNDFFPLTLHVPISIVIGNVGDDHVLYGIDTLGTPQHSEEHIVRKFWTWLEELRGSLVSFNGRRFDLPVLELAALRWGISAPHHFDSDNSARSRNAPDNHLDLCDYLTNFGEVGLRGGMDILLKMLGLPGKGVLNGALVQKYFDAGRFEEIHDYCRADVIQTYFLFLRVQLMRGRLSQTAYEAAHSASSPFLAELCAKGAKPGVSE